MSNRKLTKVAALSALTLFYGATRTEVAKAQPAPSYDNTHIVYQRDAYGNQPALKILCSSDNYWATRTEGNVRARFDHMEDGKLFYDVAQNGKLTEKVIIPGNWTNITIDDGTPVPAQKGNVIISTVSGMERECDKWIAFGKSHNIKPGDIVTFDIPDNPGKKGSYMVIKDPHRPADDEMTWHPGKVVP